LQGVEKAVIDNKVLANPRLGNEISMLFENGTTTHLQHVPKPTTEAERSDPRFRPRATDLKTVNQGGIILEVGVFFHVPHAGLTKVYSPIKGTVGTVSRKGFCPYYKIETAEGDEALRGEVIAVVEKNLTQLVNELER
jgi:hypothetical protein